LTLAWLHRAGELTTIWCQIRAMRPCAFPFTETVPNAAAP
jgi:hypothetical protein